MTFYIKKDEGTSTEPEYSKDPFFPAVEQIDADRWDKIYPYRLIVVDANKNYLPIGNSVPNDIRILSDSATIRADYSNKWSFVLPVTPQQFSISNSYAINTTFTARGVLEEHSGLRVKDIMMSGTFGIMPTRSTYDAPAKTPFIKSVLESTTRAAESIVTGKQIGRAHV